MELATWRNSWGDDVETKTERHLPAADSQVAIIETQAPTHEQTMQTGLECHNSALRVRCIDQIQVE
jgi:hypothetical protein